VTNVVESNFNLKQELKEAMREINTLSLGNANLVARIKEIELTQKMQRARGGTSSPLTDMY
jgi:regulator of replication initiation timing